MAVLAKDDFNRADEATLASPWVKPTSLSLDVCNLTSFRASSTIDDVNRAAVYIGPTWPNDQWSKARLYCVSTAGVRQGPALYVRTDIAGPGYTGYRLSTDHAASTNCNISRFLSDSRTTILDFTQAWNDGDVWELRVEGPASAARLRAFLNDVQIADVIDNSSITTGSPGVGVSNNVLISSWSIDEWSGGDLSVEINTYFTPPIFRSRGG